MREPSLSAGGSKRDAEPELLPFSSFELQFLQGNSGSPGLTDRRKIRYYSLCQ